jgi:hypothetical protein
VPRVGPYAGLFGDTSNSLAAGVVGYNRAAEGGYEVTGFAQGIGVSGQSDTGLGGSFKGGLAALRLEPSDAKGAPTTGRHQTGELVVDRDGHLFFCSGKCEPGTWVELGVTPTSTTASRLVIPPTPERFVDTRSSLGAVQPYRPVRPTRS